MMKRILFLLFITSLISVGCSREVKAPEPIAVAQIPAALEPLFIGAKPEVASVISNLVAAIKDNDPTDALSHAEKLAQLPTLSKKQREILPRIHLALVEAANAAAEKGDQRAAAEMNFRRQNK